MAKAEMPLECADIRAGIENLADDLAVEFGGESRELTPSQIILIDRVIQLTGFTKLAEKHAWRSGPVVSGPGGKPRMTPVLRESYVCYSNAIIKALRTLKEMSAPGAENSAGEIDLKRYERPKRSGSPPEGRTEKPKNQQDTDPAVHRVSTGSE
jgi:hypothetical protein